MKTDLRRSGFTLIEVLIVVVIMAILAATIIPQFSDSTKDAKSSTVKFNLHTLRSQIELYRTQHNGTPPSVTLAELKVSTDATGATGSGASFPYGPYIRDVPINPYTNKNTLTAITNDPAKATDVTGAGGWLYNTTTGGIWIDDANSWQY
jgi:type II secretion system protein G